MTKPVILAACRTAIGSAFRGSLTETSAFDLAEAVVAEALVRSGLEATDIDDVVLAEGLYGGGVIARHAAIIAGLTHVPGLAVNRHCAASLAAVQIGAAEVASAMADAVIAGGVSSPSTSPKSTWRLPGTAEVTEGWISPSHPNAPEAPNLDMSITVGGTPPSSPVLLARRWMPGLRARTSEQSSPSTGAISPKRSSRSA